MSENNFFQKQTPSSRIKANIVANYFPKYCKIILKRPQERIIYLDLFSGPGVYEDGSSSTPILIGETCAKDINLLNHVHLFFNDKEHKDKLEKEFTQRFSNVNFKFTPKFADKIVGEDDGIENFLKRPVEKGKKNPYPTLLFFDPFGYKGINTRTLGQFLDKWGNELFLFFNIKRIHAAIENDKFDDLMIELFPTRINQIREDRKYKMGVSERLSLIIDNLAEEFKAIVSNLYYCAFKFQEEDSKATSHFIIHFTKHKRGYDLVKQIYNEFDNIGAVLDKDGFYTFDAKQLDYANDLFDFSSENIRILTNQLLDEFKGQTISAHDLFEQHQVKGLYSRKHYTVTLRDMVDKGLIKSEFTDNVNHSVTVLIIKHCILKF